MQQGKQWIHFDAQYPLSLGHDLLQQFGPAGELLFVQFLCACKRSFPQGEIRYRTDEEACVLLGAHYPFVHSDGREWTLWEFWKWCGRRHLTASRRNHDRTTVVARRWDEWETTPDALRKRRSRAKNVTAAPPLRLRGEVEKEVEVEVEGGRGGSRVGSGPKNLISQLEHKTRKPNPATTNGNHP
jgi:hypothetical protein